MLLAPVPALFYALLSQKLAPAEERNSTDMSAASAAFCISALAQMLLFLNPKTFFKSFVFLPSAAPRSCLVANQRNSLES